jgi:hypothetical protein
MRRTCAPYIGAANPVNQIASSIMSARRLLEAAIASYGSEAKLAAAIGYSQNAVHLAKHRGWVTWEMACVLDHVAGIDRMKLCGDMITRRLNGHTKKAPRAIAAKRKRPATRSKHRSRVR